MVQLGSTKFISVAFTQGCSEYPAAVSVFADHRLISQSLKGSQGSLRAGREVFLFLQRFQSLLPGKDPMSLVKLEETFDHGKEHTIWISSGNSGMFVEDIYRRICTVLKNYLGPTLQDVGIEFVGGY